MNITAKARRTDPPQSHKAAERKTKSKTLAEDQMAVLIAINVFPDKTAKWIDNHHPFHISWEGKAHRRAPELEALGLITRNRLGDEMTLRITEAGIEALK